MVRGYGLRVFCFRELKLRTNWDPRRLRDPGDAVRRAADAGRQPDRRIGPQHHRAVLGAGRDPEARHHATLRRPAVMTFCYICGISAPKTLSGLWRFTIIVWRDPRRAGWLMWAYFLLSLVVGSVVYFSVGPASSGQSSLGYDWIVSAFFAWRAHSSAFCLNHVARDIGGSCIGQPSVSVQY